MRFNTSIALRLAALFAILALTVVQLRAGATAGLKSGVDLSAIDHSCKPCDDFYQYANGNWLKNNKIPADKSYYGSFGILADENIANVHKILTGVSATTHPAGSNEQKIADFYNACMNTAAIDAAGTTPISDDLALVDGLSDLSQLPQIAAKLQLDSVNVFFSYGRVPDFEDSTKNIIGIDQGGLGLPDRDYYTRTDAKSVELRKQYQTHVQKLFTLLGETNDAAAADAATVLSTETALANQQLTNVQERDVKATNNKRTLAELDALSPNFSWTQFSSGAGVAPSVADVTSPKYISALSAQLAAWTIPQIKTYLRWHVVNAYAAALPKAFRDEDFAFNSGILQGTTKQVPRWKQCAYAVDGNLGEALGQLYVAKFFPPQAKADAVDMVRNIEAAFRDDLSTIPWMSPTTRQKAVAKLDAYLIKIGYPNHWRDYSKLTISNGAYATNLMAAQKFELQRQWSQIGGPVDRTEWGMTPPTVNAYYDPTVNQIVFPAGILQPPFFDANADPAVNYGGIGAVIGHESTHGFDDQGSLYDKSGNLNDQWTKADRAKFTAKTQCIIDQFNGLYAEPGVKENGALVVGEETADLGGLTLAYRAFEKWQSTHPRRIIDGFTPEQRFFFGWAHVWESMQRPALIKLRAQTDVHAYDKLRVNATISNMPSFAKAFSCPLNSPMVRPIAKQCQIW